MTLTHTIIAVKIASGAFSTEKLHMMIHDRQWLTGRKFGNTSDMELLPIHIENYKDEEGEDHFDAAFRGRYPVHWESVPGYTETGDLFIVEIDRWDGRNKARIVKTPRQIINYLKVR